MKYLSVFILLLLHVTSIEPQKFSEETPYLLIRLMDVKMIQWKPNSLKVFEQAVDTELKYTDERKGIVCKAIDFEQEPGYPKQDARFLDISIRGICIDGKGKRHKIEKDLITKAIIREKDNVNAAIAGAVFRIGNVQLYARDRNKLNLIIIPVSIGFIALLFFFTFFLRQIRNRQKREHIIAELHKKREANQKKSQTIPNIDPHANDKQHLLQLDPTVVGNVSHTMGSSNEFTKDQYALVNRSNSSHPIDARVHNRQQDIPPPIPSKENRAPYYKREDEIPLQPKKSWNSSREQMQMPIDNESLYSPNHIQYHNEPQHIPMLSMADQQPRVVVRSIRDDGTFPTLYQQQHDDSSPVFVSIPVQIEHGVTHRFMPPPYHSDPYYPNVNS